MRQEEIMKEVYLTQEGLEELKQRLDYLIVYLREDVAKKLQHAREQIGRAHV